jgi:hypothetical protein
MKDAVITGLTRNLYGYKIICRQILLLKIFLVFQFFYFLFIATYLSCYREKQWLV